MQVAAPLLSVRSVVVASVLSTTAKVFVDATAATITTHPATAVLREANARLDVSSLDIVIRERAAKSPATACRGMLLDSSRGTLRTTMPCRIYR